MTSNTSSGLRETARKLGVSHSYLAKVAKAKPLPRNEDGSFDVEAVRRFLKAHTDPAQVRRRGNRTRSLGGHPDTVTAAEAVTNPGAVTTSDAARDAVTLVQRVLIEEGVVAGTVAVDIESARLAEMILKAHERDLRMAQRRKELVPLAKVREHITKAFIGYRLAMQRLPDRFAAEMAAELGCNETRLANAIARVVRIVLDELSAPVVRA